MLVFFVVCDSKLNTPEFWTNLTVPIVVQGNCVWHFLLINEKSKRQIFSKVIFLDAELFAPKCCQNKYLKIDIWAWTMSSMWV